MLHGILVSASVWALFIRIGASIAGAFREVGCSRCGGRLHVADYSRKPRGLGFSRGEGFTRFSFCCGSEGCRRRSTPPAPCNRPSPGAAVRLRVPAPRNGRRRLAARNPN